MSNDNVHMDDKHDEEPVLNRDDMDTAGGALSDMIAARDKLYAIQGWVEHPHLINALNYVSLAICELKRLGK